MKTTQLQLQHNTTQHNIMDSLVSPTKARQAAIEAKDWAYVNSWLTHKYAPQPVPSFERNEETLKTLLAIAAANDAADEESSLLHRAREDVVRVLGQREATEENSLVRHILDDIEAQLDLRAEQALTDLAETAVLMGGDSTDVSELASGFLQLTRDEAEFANQVRHVQALQGYSDKEMALVRQEIDEIKSHPGYETPMDLTAKTGEWTRNAKMLAAKISEYGSRITSLQRKTNIEDVRIEQVVQEERNVQELRSAISKLEAKIKSYHDLPPDIDDARNEYKRLEGELSRLTNERDELFQTRF